MKIGVTLGDPSGIGPEIIQAAFPSFDAETVVYGHPDLLPDIDPAHVINVASWLSTDDIKPGEPSDESAWIQKWALDAAIEDAKSGAIDAIVTAPWTKSIFERIDLPPTGHTEVLAEAFDAPDRVMMLAGDRLRVALVTTHVPLAEVAELVTAHRVASVTDVVVRALQQDFGIERPRIAVLGLNPHAGEDGAIGSEEIYTIVPAVESLRAQGLQIDGPISADSYFSRYLDASTANDHDAVICMYHDQGLIPLKTIHRHASANITLGLPIIRTSVDHGTAYDIAGHGTANPASLKYAHQLAVRMVRNRNS